MNIEKLREKIGMFLLETEASCEAAGFKKTVMAPQLLDAVVAYCDAKTVSGLRLFEALLRGCIDPLNEDDAASKPCPESIELIDLREQLLNEHAPLYRQSEFTGRYVVYHAGELQCFESELAAWEKVMVYQTAPETRLYEIKLIVNFGGDEGIKSATKKRVCSSRADARAMMYDTILFFDLPASFCVDGEPEGEGRLGQGFKSQEHRQEVIEMMHEWSAEWIAEEPDPAEHAEA
jgi:hypothetical protein